MCNVYNKEYSYWEVSTYGNQLILYDVEDVEITRIDIKDILTKTRNNLC